METGTVCPLSGGIRPTSRVFWRGERQPLGYNIRSIMPHQSSARRMVWWR
jgi:hypothetical protein